MIRLEEQYAIRAEATGGVRQSLEALLAIRGRSYRKALKRCRRQFSEKSVHALRVEIRRILSMLALIAAASRHDEIATLERELKDRLKSLSRLRDTQVQLDAVGKMLRDEPALERFHDWLRCKERRSIKRLRGELAQVRAGKTGRRIEGLSGNLREFVGRGNEREDLEQRLVGATAEAFEMVMARYGPTGPRDLATIHRVRLAFKKFRYMAEALARVVPGLITDRRLRAMRSYQKRVGEIQDVEVLLARFKKFTKKEESDKRLCEGFRDKLLGRRARLVKRFLNSADRLPEFWPIQPRRHSITRSSIKPDIHAIKV